MATTPFISWLGHGAACLSPPGVFTGARATIFAIEADTAAMQQLADTLLNPAGGGQVRYEAFAPLATISFMDIARCASATDGVGWLPGRECALWVPLIEYRPSSTRPARIVFWAPYIFISYTIGMVTGREIWGWPKTLAHISLPGDEPQDASYRCKTTYFPTFSGDTRAVTDTLFEVVAGGAQSAQPPSSAWRTAAEANAGLAGKLLPRAEATLRGGCSFLPQGPCVALKQFRDAGDTENACYQAICDSPVAVTAFKGAGLLPGGFTLKITTCQSHQIVQDLLGRQPDPGYTEVPIVLAAWSLLDFQALPGNNVVVTA